MSVFGDFEFVGCEVWCLLLGVGGFVDLRFADFYCFLLFCVVFVYWLVCLVFIGWRCFWLIFSVFVIATCVGF